MHAIRITQHQHNTNHLPTQKAYKHISHKIAQRIYQHNKPCSLVKHDQDKENTQKEEGNVPFPFLSFPYLRQPHANEATLLNSVFKPYTNQTWSAESNNVSYLAQR